MTIENAEIPINRYSRPGQVRKETKAIIVHWVGNPGTSARANRDYFASLAKQTAAPLRYASSQFIIGLRGEVLAIMPQDEVAWHCGSSLNDPDSKRLYTDWARSVIGEKYASRWSSPNYATIGIELCHPDASGKFTPETEASAVALCAKLCEEYDLDPRAALGRHYDVVGWKDCPRWFVANPDLWEKFIQLVALAVQ